MINVSCYPIIHTSTETLDTINLGFLDPLSNGQYMIVTIVRCTKYLDDQFMKVTFPRRLFLR